MRRLMVVGSVVALCSLPALADDVAYSYDAATETFTVTVADGATVDISVDAVSRLNANEYEEGKPISHFVKEGPGRIVVVDTNAPSAYLGTVGISNGYYRSYLTNSKANMTVGSHSGGAVTVANGATLELKTDSKDATKDSYIGKQVCFEGSGVDGTEGALCALGSTSSNSSSDAFGRPMVMTGDAMIRSKTTYAVGMPGGRTKLVMNNHKLTVKSSMSINVDGKYAAGIIWQLADTYEETLGDIELVTGSVNIGGLRWLNCPEGSRTFTIGTNTVLIVGGSWGACQAHVKMEPGAIIQCNGDMGSNNSEYGIPYDSWGNRFSGTGPFELLDPVRNTFLGAWGHYINLFTRITGGGIRVVDGMRLFVGNNNNSFTNGVEVSKARLIVTGARAIPKDGAPILLSTNAYLHVPSKLSYELPEVICAGPTNYLRGTMGYMYPLDSGDLVDACQYYSRLTLGGGVVKATTNILVTALKGFGELEGGLCELQIRDGSWEFKTSDVLAGKCLKAKSIRAMGYVSGKKFIIDADAVPKGGPRTYKVAQATDFISNVGSAPTIEMKGDKADRGEWKLRKGDDGLSWELTFYPRGTTVIFR